MVKNFLKYSIGSVIIVPIFVVSCSKQETLDFANSSNNSFIVESNNSDNQSIVCLTKQDFGEIINFSDLKDFKLYENDQEISIDYSKSYIDDDYNIFLFINSKSTNNLIVTNERLNKSFIIQKRKNLNKINLKNDQQNFINLINDISNNNIPTIIYSLDASLPIQQSFLISLINFYNNYNNKLQNINNKTIHIMSNKGFDSKRFNGDILKEKNIWNGIENIDQINETNNDDLLYLLRNNNIKVNDILSKFNINSKYDLVVQENQFFEMDIKEIFHLLKNANRVIITYDGNLHTNRTVPNLISKIQSIKVKSRKENIEFLKDLQNGKTTDLNNENFYNLMLLDKYESINENSNYDFFTFLSMDSNLLNTVNLDNDKIWNEHSISTNFLDYVNCLNNKSNDKQFLDTFSKLFIGSNLDMNDLIINGFEQYDPNKRNAIFLGSSLFNILSGQISKDNFSRLQVFPNLRKVVQAQMKQLLNKFPLEQYNIIFKLHPSFSDKNDPNNLIAINYVNLITDGLIQNPIIINPSIPIETLISNDYYIYKNKSNDSKIKNFIFRENGKFKAKEWTTFFGLQTTTSTIHTTRLFYESAFGISKQESAKLIPFFNFPIPTKFKLVDRENFDIDESTNYYEANKEKLKKIYVPYIPSIYYKNSLFKEYDSIILNFEEEK